MICEIGFYVLRMDNGTPVLAIDKGKVGVVVCRTAEIAAAYLRVTVLPPVPFRIERIDLLTLGTEVKHWGFDGVVAVNGDLDASGVMTVEIAGNIFSTPGWAGVSRANVGGCRNAGRVWRYRRATGVN